MQSYINALRYTLAIGIPFAGIALFVSLFMPWFRYHSAANKPTVSKGSAQAEKGKVESEKSGADNDIAE